MDDEPSTQAGTWDRDPAGRHQLRWHDGTTFTGWVSDGKGVGHDPLASVPGRPPLVSAPLRGRAAAARRVLLGTAAIVAGVSVSVVMSKGFTNSWFVVILPFLWGGANIVDGLRYLVMGGRTTPPREPPPTHPPGAATQLALIDRLLADGRIGPREHEMARRKIVAQFPTRPTAPDER